VSVDISISSSRARRHPTSLRAGSDLSSNPAWSYALLSPFVLVYAAFVLLPIFFGIALSLMKWDGVGTPHFIGFANFYRRFIKDWSKICKGMNDLTKKDVKWQWNKAAQKSFELLKAQFEGASILIHANSTRQFLIEADASEFAIGGILSQEGKDGHIHPISFYSKTMQPAERNYDIYDKELLAVIQCLKEWRHHLEGAVEQIKIITDHKNLEWFLTTKQLTRRQARWAEFIADFDLIIVYRPGKESGKPDALSRRPDHEPQETQEREHRIFTEKHFAMAINFVEEENIQKRIQECIP